MDTKKTKFNPVYWSMLFFVVAQVLTFCIISRENAFLQTNHIYIPPQPSPGTVSLWPQPSPTTPIPGAEAPALFWTSLGPILIYFFSVVIVLGVVLFLIPISALRYVLKVIFAFLFAWGIFIALVFWIPIAIAVIVSVAVGLAWFLVPRVWLHNTAMILAMVSVGAVFGRLISPWTAMILLLVLAVYDFFAVRFGYMVWLAKKLSESNTLPAFFIPRFMSEWKASLKENAVARLVEEEPSERDFSILGGGDIAFPLLLVSSVFFAYGLTNAILVAGFSLLGLICAYWIQATFLKGKPMPALPPIAILCLIALLIVRYH
jgi:presenilin-like A22 family membrane protease